MSLEILPSALYNNANTTALLSSHSGNSAIFYKKLPQSLLDKEIFLSTHALVYVIHGSINIRSYDGTYSKASEGELCLLTKDLYTVSDYAPNNASFEALIFFFDQASIDVFFRGSTTTRQTHSPKSLTVKADSSIRMYMAALRSVYSSPLINDAISQTKLVELLQLIELQNDDQGLIQALLAPLSTRKRDVKNFMLDHYLKNLKVAEFAELCGRSESQFNKEFKAIFQLSPAKWLSQQRLKHAKTLLSEDQTVSDVAYACGYQNLSHFIQSYKHQYGITPKQAQKLGAETQY